jgi:aminoglycoside phosphotransferase (APT) family kinase protein
MAQLSTRAASFASSITGYSCEFILDTEHHPYSGGECIIFAFEAKGKRIGVRIERSFSSATRIKVEREIQLLQAITTERIPRLPHLIGYDLESTPPLIATSWADGDKLEWTDFSPPPQTRKNILKNVAEVTLDLLEIQEPGKRRDLSSSVLMYLGGSAVEWITNKINRTRIRRSIQGSLPGVSVNDCTALLHRISDFHLPAFDDCPHVLVHGDLHPSNIIINNQQVEW